MCFIVFIIPTIGRNTLIDSINSVMKLNGNYEWKILVIFDGIKNNLVDLNTNDNIMILETEKCGNINIKNNGGMVRNIGINYLIDNKIESKYIGFLDDDDTIHPEYINNLLKEEELFDFDCIIFRMMYENYNIIPHPLTTKIEMKNVGISFLLKYEIINNENFRFINHPYEDYVFVNKIKNNKKKILISKFVNYFVRTNFEKCKNEIKIYSNILIG